VSESVALNGPCDAPNAHTVINTHLLDKLSIKSSLTANFSLMDEIKLGLRAVQGYSVTLYRGPLFVSWQILPSYLFSYKRDFFLFGGVGLNPH
jgi:hypothetical protein